MSLTIVFSFSTVRDWCIYYFFGSFLFSLFWSVT